MLGTLRALWTHPWPVARAHIPGPSSSSSSSTNRTLQGPVLFILSLRGVSGEPHQVGIIWYIGLSRWKEGVFIEVLVRDVINATENILIPSNTSAAWPGLSSCMCKTVATFYRSQMLRRGALQTEDAHHVQVTTLHCQWYPFHASSRRGDPAAELTIPLSMAIACGAVASVRSWLGGLAFTCLRS